MQRLGPIPDRARHPAPQRPIAHSQPPRQVFQGACGVGRNPTDGGISDTSGPAAAASRPSSPGARAVRLAPAEGAAATASWIVRAMLPHTSRKGRLVFRIALAGTSSPLSGVSGPKPGAHSDRARRVLRHHGLVAGPTTHCSSPFTTSTSVEASGSTSDRPGPSSGTTQDPRHTRAPASGRGTRTSR